MDTASFAFTALFCAMLVVGLLGAAVLASGGMVRALAMVLLGMQLVASRV